MKATDSKKSIQFYLLLFSIIGGVIFVLQLILLLTNKSHPFFLILSCSGFLLICIQVYFIKRRFVKELELLWKSIRLVIDHNFSRKFKLHIINSDDEIGQISSEVSIMLQKLHYRTTEVLQRRKELHEAGKNIEMLGVMGREITSKLTIRQIIQTTFTHINQLLDVSFLAIGIWDPEKNGLNYYGIKTNNSNIFYGFDDMKDSHRWGVYCFNEQQEIFCNHYEACSNHYFSALLFDDPIEKRESFIYLPLTLRDQKIGVFTVQSFNQDAYTVYHFNLLKNLANYLIVAIINAQAFQKIESQTRELIKVSSKLKDAQQSLEQKVISRTSELVRQKLEIERKNIELERLSLVARKTDNAIMIMDAKGNIEWINDCFSRIYNYTFEDFIAKRGKNILQTSFYPKIDQVLKKCLLTRKSVYYEAANITGDGREIWTQTTLTPVLNNYGEITHLLTIDSDISKRKEYEIALTQKSNEIRQSILYAQQIQNAVLPPESWFTSRFKDCFILYKPKDIVSGDFYWISKRNDKIIVALGDCTGHGVPGAFMSMLGVSLLNEIASSKEWSNSGQLLDLLRMKIKTSLRQNHNDYSNADGMDIGVCIIDKKNKKLQFSGANNSLFLIRNEEIQRIRGDKMPVGLYINDDVSFETCEIHYSSSDKYYLSTDGYADQFGGERDSKFTIKRFKNLLQQVHQLPFENQKERLETHILEWQGNTVQVDDICVIGFEIE